MIPRSDFGDDVLAPGSGLGNYRIERTLGHGGMGIVYLAYDTTLHRLVALKVMIDSTRRETSPSSLLREARNAAALKHPNICTVYEVGDADGFAFIAMEYEDGPSLRERIDSGAVALDEVISYGLQAADALSHAHEHGVVHRDFKAANAIAVADGRLKVVDFGLARREDAAMATATTMASLVPKGVLAGTAYSMAPEQVRGEATDARADIWALGVLLYEMASGSKPFDARTTAELFSSILRDAPKPLPAPVPTDLRLIIERCLEKVRERRYQHASEVRRDLAALQAGGGAPWSTSRYRLAQRPWLVAAWSIAGIGAVLLGLSLAGARDRLAGRTSATAPVKLAVLPLDNVTGDPEQEYFSDGVTEGIITSLSRLRSARLGVVARTLSARYKRSDRPLEQIGRELDADAVLKGSVTRSGDRARVFVELVQTSNSRQLWTQTYERTVSDLFTVEHEISNAVSAAIGLQLGEPEKNQRPAETHKVNPEAYDLYLRGLFHANRQSEQEIDQAIALLEKSAALDPTFVPAQAYLAFVYGNKSSTYRPNEPEWEEKGFAAVRKAINLDPDAPEAHYAQAMMLWRPSHGFPSRDALLELRKALSAQPNFDEAWHQHALILMHVGHLDTAARHIQRALEINPGNTTARFRYGPIYVYQQRFEDAIAALDRVPRETFPAQWTFQRTWALISLGRFEEAGSLLDGALKNNPVDQGGVLHAARAMLRATRGDRKAAEADVAEAIRVGRNFLHFHHTAYAVGVVYATLGELTKAQEWIEQAANNGFPNYAYFETDHHLDRLRATPRFQAFLSKLRTEWEHIPGETE